MRDFYLTAFASLALACGPQPATDAPPRTTARVEPAPPPPEEPEPAPSCEITRGLAEECVPCAASECCRWELASNRRNHVRIGCYIGVFKTLARQRGVIEFPPGTREESLE